MLQFLINYWQLVIIVVVFGIIIPLFFVATKKWNKLRTYTYTVIRTAEHTIVGTKLGQERFDFVLDKIYNYLIPSYLQWAVPKSLFNKKLQDWFNDVKDYLDDGKRNKSQEATKDVI